MSFAGDEPVGPRLDVEEELTPQEICDQVKVAAWRTYVFVGDELDCGVGYGRLNCECHSAGGFLTSFTAATIDLGDTEAGGAISEASASEDEEASASEDEVEEVSAVSKKRKAKDAPNPAKKPKKDQKWRDEQDRAWIDKFVERDGDRIFQIPQLQTSMVVSGLTNLRTTVLSEFQKAAKLFKYNAPVFSGSPAGVFEDLVKPSVIPHGLSNQIDPLSWQEYEAPESEALCTFWCYCDSPHFCMIPCGNAPGETHRGQITSTLQAKMDAICPDWRGMLATATVESYSSEVSCDQLIAMVPHIAAILRASFPLKLVYVTSLGQISRARNLERLRAFFQVTRTISDVPISSCPLRSLEPSEILAACRAVLAGVGVDGDDDEDAQEKKQARLDILNPPSLPELDKIFPQWLSVLSASFHAEETKTVEAKEDADEPKKPLQRVSLQPCHLCPFRKQTTFLRTFFSWQRLASSKFHHLCVEHGPFGANQALLDKGVPQWIRDFYFDFAEANREVEELVYDALWKLGYRQCGFYQQGGWNELPRRGFAWAKSRAEIESKNAAK